MPHLVLNRPDDPDPSRDVWGREIVASLATAGYTISLPDAVAAWEAYSESVSAGWIMHNDLPGEAIFHLIEPYVTVQED